MKVKVDNRSFEETIADERRLLQEGNESEEMLSEEEIDEIVENWFAKHKHEWKHVEIPDYPAINGMSQEEFDAEVDRAFRNQDWDKLARLHGHEPNPCSKDLYIKLAFIRGYID